MRKAFLAALLLFGCAAPIQGPALTASPEQAPQRVSSLPGPSWAFAVLGDNRGDRYRVFPVIVQRIHDDELAFVVHLGDMVQSGGERQLKAFTDAAAPIRGCLFPVIGNHEIRRDKDRHAFKAAFGLKGTSYSFSFNNAHVVVIDNASQEFSDGVLKWLRSDLEKHKKGVGGIEWVFVAMHIPPSGLGVQTHVDGEKAQLFEAGSRGIMDLLREYAVDVILAGHVHRAQVTDVPGGPRLVISGAAGAPQYRLGSPTHGYHRVTVTGAEVQIDFVAVSPGETMAASARASRPACPKVDATYEAY
jgi:predicted phosphodiesterase